MVQVGSGELGWERMEFGLEGFKSGVGVEVVRGVGRLVSKRLESGSEEFNWVEGSGWDQGGRRYWGVGFGSGWGWGSGGVGVG